MPFYGHLYRPAGERLAFGDPIFTAADVEPGLEEELSWPGGRNPTQADPMVAPPGSSALVRVPGSAQAALRQLTKSKFFGGVALRSPCSTSSR